MRGDQAANEAALKIGLNYVINEGYWNQRRESGQDRVRDDLSLVCALDCHTAPDCPSIGGIVQAFALTLTAIANRLRMALKFALLYVINWPPDFWSKNEKQFLSAQFKARLLRLQFCGSTISRAKA